jgi:hypothetical protein
MTLRSCRLVVAGGSALVAASLVGGAVSVAAGVNTWSTAWTGAATLAAPGPMLAVQALSTAAAAHRRVGVATAGSAVLGLAALLSGISGFFDGQLGRSDLGAGFVAAQVTYVAVAFTVAGLATYRFWDARRPAPGR